MKTSCERCWFMDWHNIVVKGDQVCYVYACVVCHRIIYVPEAE